MKEAGESSVVYVAKDKECVMELCSSPRLYNASYTHACMHSHPNAMQNAKQVPWISYAIHERNFIRASQPACFFSLISNSFMYLTKDFLCT